MIFRATSDNIYQIKKIKNDFVVKNLKNFQLL